MALTAQDELFLFMEYCGEGTIWDVAKQGLTIDMIRKYSKEITVGLDELHRRHIVHRDIKGLCMYMHSYPITRFLNQD